MPRGEVKFVFQKSILKRQGNGKTYRDLLPDAQFFSNENNAVATARTCYSPKVVLPEDVDKDEKSRRKSVMPICHRSYHKNGYLGTEIPGFREGGANRLLRRVLPAQGSVVIVSYSNGTSPRGEFIPRADYIALLKKAVNTDHKWIS